MSEDFDKYYEATEPGMRERAYAWATAIGLQDVDGLKPSKYLLATAKRHIEGEISQEDARRLIDEYYETKLGHDKLEEYYHRREDVIDDGINDANDGINDGITCGNDGINFSASEEKAIKLILQTPTITAVKLAEALACKKRHAERIIASLKKMAGLVREGSRKSGIWRFSKRVNV